MNRLNAPYIADVGGIGCVRSMRWWPRVYAQSRLGPGLAPASLLILLDTSRRLTADLTAVSTSMRSSLYFNRHSPQAPVPFRQATLHSTWSQPNEV